MNNIGKIEHYITQKTGDMELPDGLSQEDCAKCVAQVLNLVDLHMKGQMRTINVQLKQLLQASSEGIEL